MKCLRAILPIVLLAMSASVPAAQNGGPLVTLENELDAARKLMANERKLAIADELTMTRAESDAFWPVYNEYVDAVRPIGDKKVSLITQFAENYQHMSDETARDTIDEYFDLEERYLAVRRKYLKRFRRVLPEVKVAKLFQVENKLDAVMDYKLAAQVPMIR